MALINGLIKFDNNLHDLSFLYVNLEISKYSQIEFFPIPATLGFVADEIGFCVPQIKTKNITGLEMEFKNLITTAKKYNLVIIEMYDGESLMDVPINKLFKKLLS